MSLSACSSHDDDGSHGLKEIREINGRLGEVQNNWVQSLALGDSGDNLALPNCRPRSSARRSLRRGPDREECAATRTGSPERLEQVRSPEDHFERTRHIDNSRRFDGARGRRHGGSGGHATKILRRTAGVHRKTDPPSACTDELLDRERLLSRDGAYKTLRRGARSPRVGNSRRRPRYLPTTPRRAIAYRLVRDISNSIRSDRGSDAGPAVAIWMS